MIEHGNKFVRIVIFATVAKFIAVYDRDNETFHINF